VEHYAEVSFGETQRRDYGKRLSEIFQAAHRALNKAGEGLVGLSFPDWAHGATSAGVSLGQRFYLVSSDADVLKGVVLELQEEQTPLILSEIRPVPADAGRAIFCRSRQHQRYFHHQRHGDEQGKADAAEKLGDLRAIPTVRIASKSTRQSFRIAIDCRPPESEVEGSSFNSYGLSSNLSVPVF